MKFLSKFVVLFLCLTLILPALDGQEEDLVQVDASINPQRLSKGNNGNVVLRFHVRKGITINPQPSFIIELSPSEELVFGKNFFTAADFEIEILKEDDRESLVLSKEIEIPFSVGSTAERGTHTLEGKVKYFAFSQEENWCLKTTSLFQASFYTR